MSGSAARLVPIRIGGDLYNPENLELPDDEDPRLIDYVWEYSVGSFVHAIGVNSKEWDLERSPEVSLDFYTPFKYSADFHLLMWPEDSHQPMPDISFDFVELDRSHPKSSGLRSEIASLLDLSDPDYWLDSWCDRAKDSDFDKLFIQRWAYVRYEWNIRGFKGLTLKHLKENLELIEWSKDFSLTEGGDAAEILESTELFNENYLEYESLRYNDAELGALASMEAYRENPSEALALDAAYNLHRFGGPELASFHFPNLDLCGSCGERSHLGTSANCESRLATLWL